MGLFSKVIDEYGFYMERKAQDILEDNVPREQLDRLMNVWSECPDIQYSRTPMNERYKPAQIVELFRRKCEGRSFAKRHVNVFAEFQLVRLKSKESK
jgi:hypothetical protein